MEAVLSDEISPHLIDGNPNYLIHERGFDSIYSNFVWERVYVCMDSWPYWNVAGY